VEQSTRRRRLRKAERRRVIEDAASELFAEHGYTETRLRDIAAAAGVTKQLLYQHFRSKKELYLALFAKHRDGLLARIATGMSRPAPLAERLPTVIDAWLAYLEENPYAAELLFRDTTGDPDVQAFLRENHATARGLQVALMKAEPELDIPDDQLEPVAEFYRSAGAGLALWWAEHPEVPRSTLLGIIVAAYTEGLTGAQSSKKE
jgi:AcrR family transcriptional regulator